MSKEILTATPTGTIALASPQEDILLHTASLTGQLLPAYLKTCRWFGGKARTIEKVQIAQKTEIPGAQKSWLLILQVDYSEGQSELYLLPLAVAFDNAAEIRSQAAKAVIGEVSAGQAQGIVYDVLYDASFRHSLFAFMHGNRTLTSEGSTLHFEAGKPLLQYSDVSGVRSRVLNVEQSNSSVIYDEKFFLKLYRKLDRAINPDLEINRFFAEKTDFTNAPSFAGAIELKETGQSLPVVIGMMQEMIANEGDAWASTLPMVKSYFEKAVNVRTQAPQQVSNFEQLADNVQQMAGKTMAARVKLLARRTAEMHLALASDDQHPDFRPESFTTATQRELSAHLGKMTGEKFDRLQAALPQMPVAVQPRVEQILRLQPEIAKRFGLEGTIGGFKTRIHGDYHLGQVLFNGSDYIIIDFEGEPASSFDERRHKYSPLKDVAGMVRSFHYATYAALLQNAEFSVHIEMLTPWAELWYSAISGTYLETYLETIRAHNPALLPDDEKALQDLLQVLLLEKAVYEFYYEANNRPDWMMIPYNGIMQLMGR